MYTINMIFSVKINIFFKFIFCYSITVVPIFFHLPSSTQPSPPTVKPILSSMSMGPLYMFFDQSPSPSFLHHPPHPPLWLLSVCSMSLVLFCSLVSFVYQIPLLSEIIYRSTCSKYMLSRFQFQGPHLMSSVEYKLLNNRAMLLALNTNNQYMLLAYGRPIIS